MSAVFIMVSEYHSEPWVGQRTVTTYISGFLQTTLPTATLPPNRTITDTEQIPAAAGTEKRRAIVLLTQTFPPDPAAVGQHMADLADALARRGHRVRVLTSDRGYDDASAEYLRREITPAGVEVRRLRLASFGKATIAHRIAAMVSFICQAGASLLFQRDLGAVVFSTSPPFVGILAIVAGAVRKAPAAFWAMDLNPDQLVALGKLPSQGPVARILRAINRSILRRAAIIIALDELMAERLRQQAGQPIHIEVIPPWSPDKALSPVPPARNTFRATHGLGDKIVVMYSGNHTPSNPLTTLLDAVVALRDCDTLRFVFVGSGIAKQEVEQYIKRYSLHNVLTLPYQPKSTLSDSLSAADVHVVSLGTPMAGVIHPCKVYGAMAVARPILYFGPSPSHVAAILDEWQNGWAINHGDVPKAINVLRHIASLPHETLARTGERGRTALDSKFDPTVLCDAVAEAIERALVDSLVARSRSA
jgi:colanic acid biosynthesis glycosyl transferase WcaI